MVRFDKEDSRKFPNLIDPDEVLAGDWSMDGKSEDIIVGGLKIDQDTWDNLDHIQHEKVDWERTSRPVGWDNVEVGNIVILYENSMFSPGKKDISTARIEFYNQKPHRVVRFEGDRDSLEYSVIVSPLDRDENLRICFEDNTDEDDFSMEIIETIWSEDSNEKLDEFPAGPCLISDRVLAEWVDHNSEIVSSLI